MFFLNKMLGRSGQGLVSVLVAGSVGAVVIGFITDMMVQQGINQKFLAQKMETGDLTSNIISTFSRATNCSCQFANDAGTNPNHSNYDTFLKFNSNIKNGSQFIDVKKIYAGCLGGAIAPPLIAEEGQILPNSMTQSLRVESVQLVNLRPTGATPDEWQGQWRISFQVGAGSAIRSIRPVLITQKVTVDNPNSAAARIINCTGLSTGTGNTNYLAKWSPITGVLEDSQVFEDATEKVGIGTNTPQAVLHIKKNDPDLLRLDRPATVAGGPALDFFDSTTPLGALGQIAIVKNLITENGANMIFYTKPHGFAGLGAPKMTLTHTGLLGLGTLAPSAKLQVDTLNDEPSIAAGLSGRRVTIGTWANVATVTGWEQSTGVHNDLSLRAWSGTQLYLRNNGNIGIGTANPQDSLHVEGNIRLNNTAQWAGVDMYLNGGNRSTVYNDINYPGSVAFDTPGGSQPQKMIIRNGGNVGIGTTNPAYPLVIRNGLGGVNTVALMLETTTINAGFVLKDSGTTISPGIFSAGNNIVFYTNNTEKMRLAPDGSFTVGGTCIGGPCISDIRVKKNISDYRLGINELLQLQPKNYSFNGRAGTPDDGKMTVGLIAQDVQKSVPRLVQTLTRESEQGDAKPTDFLGINYSELIYIVINSIKEIFHRNQQTDTRLELLEKKLLHLETKYKSLEQSCRNDKF